MFGICSKIVELQKRISDLEQDKANLIHLLETSEKAMADELAKATPMLDFDIMRVFSIERMAVDDKPCTVIGHYINEPILSNDGEMVVDRDVVHQWYLYCNNERHEELIQNFIEWKATNGK